MGWFDKRENRDSDFIDGSSIPGRKGMDKVKRLSERVERLRKDVQGEHLVPIVLDGAPGVPHSRALTCGESVWCDICGGFYLPHQH